MTVAKVADAAEGGAAGTFRFSRTGITSAALTVAYTVGGTATAGADYTALSGTVTFPAGAATVDVSVGAIDDVAADAGETVSVTVAVGTGYGVTSPASATVTILDDEAAPNYWLGGTGDWNTAANWSLGVPTATSALYFDGSQSNASVTIPSGGSGTTQFAELHLVGGYTGTVTLSNNVTVRNLELTSGTLNKPATSFGSDLTVTVAMLWTGGTLNNTTNLATLTLSGASATFAPVGGGTVSIGSNLTLTNSATAVIFEGDYDFKNLPEVTVKPGTKMEAKPLTVTTTVKYIGVKQINVEAATFQVSGPGTFDASGVPMYNSSGVVTFLGSTTVKLGGSVTIPNLGIQTSISYYQDGTSYLQLEAGSELRVAKETRIAGGTLRTLYNPNLADTVAAQTATLTGALAIRGGTVSICYNPGVGGKHYGTFYVEGTAILMVAPTNPELTEPPRGSVTTGSLVGNLV